MWFEHLHTVDANSKRDATHAAATRKRNMQQKRTNDKSSYYCAVCLNPYQEFTEEVEDWIGCSKCDSWFHFVCFGIHTSSVPKDFVCEDRLV